MIPANRRKSAVLWVKRAGMSKAKHGGNDVGVMNLFSGHRILLHRLQQLVSHCGAIVMHDQIILKTAHIPDQRDNGNVGGQGARSSHGRQIFPQDLAIHMKAAVVVLQFLKAGNSMTVERRLAPKAPIHRCLCRRGCLPAVVRA